MGSWRGGARRDLDHSQCTGKTHGSLTPTPSLLLKRFFFGEKGGAVR